MQRLLNESTSQTAYLNPSTLIEGEKLLSELEILRQRINDTTRTWAKFSTGQIERIQNQNDIMLLVLVLAFIFSMVFCILLCIHRQQHPHSPFMEPPNNLTPSAPDAPPPYSVLPLNTLRNEF
jgi:hypothetical protein